MSLSLLLAHSQANLMEPLKGIVLTIDFSSDWECDFYGINFHRHCQKQINKDVGWLRSHIVIKRQIYEISLDNELEFAS